MYALNNYRTYIMKRKSETNNDIKMKKKKPDKNKFLSSQERQRHKTSSYRAPTSDELSELKENKNLYKNNLFRMQIQYLLEEVSLNEEKAKKFNSVLHSLNEFLKCIPAAEESCQVSGDCLPSDVTFPIPELISRSKVKGKFQFFPPKDVKVVGSYLLKTLTKPNHCVDIAVEMPEECLQARDYLNYRYHFKRSCYITWVASELKGWEHADLVTFSYCDNIYKPVILIKMKGKIGKRYSIRLLTSIPEGVFKLSRFAPLQNNVRSNWFDNLDEETAEEKEYPTAFYNSSILSDMLYERHLHTLYNALKECSGMKDAICLFKVWLKQRTFKSCSESEDLLHHGYLGEPEYKVEEIKNMNFSSTLSASENEKELNSSQTENFHWCRCKNCTVRPLFIEKPCYKEYGIILQNELEIISCITDHWVRKLEIGVCSFNGFIGSMLMVYLLQTRKISPHMSSYQIFRIVLHSLATSDWTTKGITLCTEDDHKCNVGDFHASSDVVFVDPSGYSNFCSNVNNVTYDMVRYEAQLSLDILDNSMIDGFTAVFIKYHSFEQSVDHHFRLSYLNSFKEKVSREECYRSKVIDAGGDWSQLLPKAVSALLLKGLHKRIYRVLLKPTMENEWSIISPPPQPADKFFIFGIHLNTEFSDNIIDMGPPADQPEAKDFRAFWGPKSELRRFQDGSINEAVIWPCVSIEEQKMQKLIVERSTKVKTGCGEEEFENFTKTYEALCKQIRSLDDLPLKINAIHAIDPAFRLTEVITPFQCKTKFDSQKNLLIPKSGKKCANWCPVYKALIQFETSGKWPDDIDAIQHIKAAFHIKLADLLQQQCDIHAVPTPTFVDAVKNGYVFRFSVVYYREMVLCTESSAAGLLKKQHEAVGKKLDMLIVKKPLHNTLIHSLTGQHSAYALTTRLSKRWIASQMLSGCLRDEAIELVVAALFLSPAPLEAPSSHYCGFMRFLNFMAKFDWQNEPLIVNLNDQLTAEDYSTIQESFTSNRSQLPPAFIAVPYDVKVSVWTKHEPAKQILRRMSLLADAALKLVDGSEFSLSEQTVKQMFRPPLSDYDIIIEMNKDFTPLYPHAVDSQVITKPLTIKESISSSYLPVVKFDPVRLYLEGLRDTFSDVASFFHDEYGGTKIGVVWKSSATTPQPFKILHAQYKMLVKQKKSQKQDILSTAKTMIANIPAIISDFSVIGKGLVLHVKENT